MGCLQNVATRDPSEGRAEQTPTAKGCRAHILPEDISIAGGPSGEHLLEPEPFGGSEPVEPRLCAVVGLAGRGPRPSRAHLPQELQPALPPSLAISTSLRTAAGLPLGEGAAGRAQRGPGTGSVDPVCTPPVAPGPGPQTA